MAKIRCDCYSFLDKDFNIVKTMSGEKIERKYNIHRIENELKRARDFYLDGCLIIENDFASKELLQTMMSNIPKNSKSSKNSNGKSSFNKMHQRHSSLMEDMFSNTDEQFELFEETLNQYYYISTQSEVISIHKTSRKRHIMKKLIRHKRSCVSIEKKGHNRYYYIDDIMQKCFFSSLNKNYKVVQIVENPLDYSLDNLKIVKKEKWELLEGFKCFYECVKAKYYVDKNATIVKENLKNGKLEKIEGRCRNNVKTIKFDGNEKRLAAIVLGTFTNQKVHKSDPISYKNGNSLDCSLKNIFIKRNTKIVRNTDYLEFEKRTMETRGYRFVSKNSEYALYVNKNGQFVRISVKTGKQFLVKLGLSKNKKHYQIKVNGKAKVAEYYIVETFKDHFDFFDKHKDGTKYKIEFKDNNNFNLRLDNLMVLPVFPKK